MMVRMRLTSTALGWFLTKLLSQNVSWLFFGGLIGPGLDFDATTRYLSQAKGSKPAESK